MRKVIGIMAVALLLAGPAFAQPTGDAWIKFHLQIGGTPGEPYTPGQENFDEPPVLSGVVNWAVRVEAGGTYGATPETETDIWGVANVVWDLMLYKADALGVPEAVTVGDAGSSVATIFGHSDGTTPGFFSVATPAQAAAFAKTFQVYMGEDEVGYYTIKDPADNGASGPGLSRFTYPSTVGLPENSQAKSGTLMGMGAGYTQYNANLDGPMFFGTPAGPERPGVGLADALVCGSMGHTITPYANIIAEGQIQLGDLPGGNYVLKLVPGKGCNVLRGDTGVTCEFVIEGNFAAAPVDPANVEGDELLFSIAATTGTLVVNITPPGIGAWSIDGGATWNAGGAALDLTPGDYTVTFQDAEGYAKPDDVLATVVLGELTQVDVEYTLVQVDPPVMLAAESVRTHGTAGTFAIPLNLAGPIATCEGRGDNSLAPACNPRVVVTFDKEIQDLVANPAMTVTASATTNVAGVTPNAPVVGELLVAGNTLTIPLTNATDKTCVTLTIENVKGTDGATGEPYTIKLAYLFGDVDGDRRCAASDLSWVKVKQAAFTNVGPETFMYDIDCNGRCAASDLSWVKVKQAAFTTVNCPVP